MADVDKLNEMLCLIDIFRFTVKSSEVTTVHEISSQLSSENAPSPQKPKTFKIPCLDLSSRLVQEKFIEESDDKPWVQLRQILFNRLMIEDYNACKLVTVSITDHEKLLHSPNLYANSPGNEFSPSDSQTLRYLYGCYYRLQSIKSALAQRPKVNSNLINSVLHNAEEMILDQVVLYLTEPDLFPDREKRYKNNQPAPLLLNLVSKYYTNKDDSHMDTIQKFVNSIGESCQSVRPKAYEANIIMPTYVRLTQKFNTMAIDDPSGPDWFNIAKVFMQQPDMASAFLQKNILRKDNSISYQSTLLGLMLCISPLPRPSLIETTFFNNMARFDERDYNFTETQLGMKLKLLGQELHTVFRSLLKMPETKNAFLTWMGRCLHTFKDRKKLWSNQVLMSTTTISVNDGFLMNFLTVMLHLSEPIAGPYNLDVVDSASTHGMSLNKKKLIKVDPNYCKYSKMSSNDCPVHFLGLAEETFLIDSGRSSNQGGCAEVQADYQPNFISECFYGTHQAFTYGFRSIYERFFKLAQNITEMRQQYASIASLPSPNNMSGSDPREMIKERIDSAMTQLLNLKAVLMVPDRITMQLHFCLATASYLNHLVACRSKDEALDAKELKRVTSDLLKEKRISRDCLEYIPEMLVENVLDFFLFLKNFNDQALTQARDLLNPLMTLIVTFMGNSSLMQNPHLRARFAEILECLMPHVSNHPHHSTFTGVPELFERHELAYNLAPSLVNVFVSIEMTGEGVQFEQKFSYRRPMYVVLEYLWGMDVHKRNLIELAEEAENNIDSSRPPLFLRFINLLMNDAIFLLDEALSYMNQLSEGEKLRRTEEWQRLGPQQRAQREASYSHIGRLARFHNVLSLSTIGTLAWLTSEIKTIFCHPTLVDRIANMLNYFLEHLVGPKKGKFNVSDKNDYEFKPRDILEKICQIYINLGQKEKNVRKFQQFCTAVSSDGRSYTEHLLPQATEILFRTGLSSLGTEFEKLSQLVHKVAVQNQMDEIQPEDIPDTFLDPIMSTIMVDPVLLPSSHIIVDRSTIARHLLSDQTDPFNRSPLSMEDVIPETDLKNQIETFLKERRESQQKQLSESALRNSEAKK